MRGGHPAKSFRQLIDVAKVLHLPADHYVPGKIHSRLDMGSDGWLYCATHRGSTTVTADKNHYEGDWILRGDPKTGNSVVVVRGPAPNVERQPRRQSLGLLRADGDSHPGVGAAVRPSKNRRQAVVLEFRLQAVLDLLPKSDRRTESSRVRLPG